MTKVDLNSEFLRQRYAEMQRANVSSNVNAYSPKAASTEVSSVNVARINEIAKKYVAKSGEVDSSNNVSTTVPYIPYTQPELQKVNTITAIQHINASNINTPNAVNYTAKVASNPYQLTANSYPNMDVYNQLANVKLS